MKTRNAWLFFFIALLCFCAIGTQSARAGLNSQLSFEEKIQTKVSRIVHAYDAFANVRVAIYLKKLSAPLPGTAIDLTNYAGGNDEGIDLNDIQSVRVTIESSKFPLPEWVKQNVGAELNFLGGRRTIDYQQMPEDMRKDLEGSVSSQEKVSIVADSLFRKYSSFAEGLMTNLTMKLMLGFIALALLTLSAAAGISFWLTKKKIQELSHVFEEKFLPAIQSINSLGGGKISTSVKLEGGATAGGIASANNDHDAIVGLSPEALAALLSDCYWCEQDAYAAWIWSTMSPVQRKALHQSTFIDPDYFKYIKDLPKEARQDHLDPVYMEPMTLQHLSQKDLAPWVQKNPSAWHFLSSMRQLSLPISLEQRLKLLREGPKKQGSWSELPQKPSEKRVLKAHRTFEALSFEDETSILNNPTMVPETLRSSMRSLVWLALKPVEYRQKTLSEWSAEELAESWWGAPPVLKKLEEALPEKKLELLRSFKSAPHKNTETFQALCEAGMKMDSQKRNAA